MCESQNNYFLMCAAMYLSLGKKTKLSASGFSIIFDENNRLNGRADLSCFSKLAESQMKHANISIDDLTENDIESYRKWREEKDNEKTMKHARMFVTSFFNDTYSGSTGECSVFQRIVLVDGMGNDVDSVRIEGIKEWDSNATNQMGMKGAVVFKENKKEILRLAEDFKSKYPAIVTDHLFNDFKMKLN